MEAEEKKVVVEMGKNREFADWQSPVYIVIGVLLLKYLGIQFSLLELFIICTVTDFVVNLAAYIILEKKAKRYILKHKKILEEPQKGEKVLSFYNKEATIKWGA